MAREILYRVMERVDCSNINVEINVWIDDNLETRVFRRLRDMDYYQQRCDGTDLRALWTRDPMKEMANEGERVKTLLFEQRQKAFQEWKARKEVLDAVNQALLGSSKAPR